MRKLTVAISLGVVLALVGGILVFMYGRSVDRRIADGKETTSVLVAAEDLETGTPATELVQKVAKRDIPSAYVADGAIEELEEVQDLVLLGPVPTGAILNRLNFGSPAAVALVEASEGNIALAIEVGISPGVARYVRVGSFVDMFVTYTGGGAGTQSQGQQGPSLTGGRTKLFLSGVKVLAVSIAVPEDAEGQEAGTQTSRVIAVLDITPQQAEMVVNATSLGDVYLGLSKPGVKHTTPTGVVPDDVVKANR